MFNDSVVLLRNLLFAFKHPSQVKSGALLIFAET